MSTGLLGDLRGARFEGEIRGCWSGGTGGRLTRGAERGSVSLSHQFRLGPKPLNGGAFGVSDGETD